MRKFLPISMQLRSFNYSFYKALTHSTIACQQKNGKKFIWLKEKEGKEGKNTLNRLPLDLSIIFLSMSLRYWAR